MNHPATRRTFVYSLYGLAIESDLPLAACQAPPGTPVDLTVRMGTRVTHDGTTSQAPVRGMTSTWMRNGDGWCLRYVADDGHVLEFAIDEGATTVDVRCSVPDSDADVAAALLGSGLAAALAIRHVPVFHASAVVIDGRALLVAGRSGSGKSTLTSALVAAGAGLLSDDMAALSIDLGGVTVHPGGRVLRVHQQSADAVAAAIGGPRLTLPRVFSARSPEDKLGLDPSELPGGRATAAAPVALVCLLAGRRPELHRTEVERLSPHQAGLALIEHLYNSSLRLAAPAEQLAWSARVASSAQVIRVTSPDHLGSVSRTAIDLIDRVRRFGDQSCT